MCLCICGAFQNKLGWITLEELHRLCGVPSLEQQTHTKPLACRQVGIVIVFSLARIWRGFPFPLQSHRVMLLLLGIFSCSQTASRGASPILWHPQPLSSMRSCSLLFPSLQPHSSCLSHHPALPYYFVSWLLIMVDGLDFLQTRETESVSRSYSQLKDLWKLKMTDSILSCTEVLVEGLQHVKRCTIKHPGYLLDLSSQMMIVLYIFEGYFD